MGSKSKRLLAWLLTAMMAVVFIPCSSFAAGDESEDIQTPVVEQDAEQTSDEPVISDETEEPEIQKEPVKTKPRNMEDGEGDDGDYDTPAIKFTPGGHINEWYDVNAGKTEYYVFTDGQDITVSVEDVRNTNFELISLQAGKWTGNSVFSPAASGTETDLENGIITISPAYYKTVPEGNEDAYMIIRAQFKDPNSDTVDEDYYDIGVYQTEYNYESCLKNRFEKVLLGDNEYVERDENSSVRNSVYSKSNPFNEGTLFAKPTSVVIGDTSLISTNTYTDDGGYNGWSLEFVKEGKTTVTISYDLYDSGKKVENRTIVCPITIVKDKYDLHLERSLNEVAPEESVQVQATLKHEYVNERGNYEYVTVKGDALNDYIFVWETEDERFTDVDNVTITPNGDNCTVEVGADFDCDGYPSVPVICKVYRDTEELDESALLATEEISFNVSKEFYRIKAFSGGEPFKPNDLQKGQSTDVSFGLEHIVRDSHGTSRNSVKNATFELSIDDQSETAISFSKTGNDNEWRIERTKSDGTGLIVKAIYDPNEEYGYTTEWFWFDYINEDDEDSDWDIWFKDYDEDEDAIAVYNQSKTFEVGYKMAEPGQISWKIGYYSRGEKFNELKNVYSAQDDTLTISKTNMQKIYSTVQDRYLWIQAEIELDGETMASCELPVKIIKTGSFLNLYWSNERVLGETWDVDVNQQDAEMVSTTYPDGLNVNATITAVTITNPKSGTTTKTVVSGKKVRDEDGNYVWTFAPVATYSSPATIKFTFSYRGEDDEGGIVKGTGTESYTVKIVNNRYEVWPDCDSEVLFGQSADIGIEGELIRTRGTRGDYWEETTPISEVSGLEFSLEKIDDEADCFTLSGPNGDGRNWTVTAADKESIDPDMLNDDGSASVGFKLVTKKNGTAVATGDSYMEARDSYYRVVAKKNSFDFANEADRADFAITDLLMVKKFDTSSEEGIAGIEQEDLASSIKADFDSADLFRDGSTEGTVRLVDKVRDEDYWAFSLDDYGVQRVWTYAEFEIPKAAGTDEGDSDSDEPEVYRCERPIDFSVTCNGGNHDIDPEGEPCIPATTRDDGLEGCYICRDCGTWFNDPEGKSVIGEERETIPSIESQKLLTTSYTYDGTAKEPKAKILNCYDDALVEGTDYTIEYANNINANPSSATTGAPTATIKYQGRYAGTRTFKFTILKAPQNISASISRSSIYAGKKPAVITVGDTVESPLADSKNIGPVTASSNNTGVATVAVNGKEVTVQGKAAGTATITVKVGGNENIAAKTKTFTVKVLATTSLTNCTITVPSCSYTGFAREPSVTVKYKVSSTKTVTLKKDVDYKVTGYSNNINAGTNTAKVTISSNDPNMEKYRGAVTKTFTIKKVANPGLTITRDSNVKLYVGKNNSSVITASGWSALAEGVPVEEPASISSSLSNKYGYVSVSRNNTAKTVTVKPVKPGTVTVTATAAATTNFNGLSKSFKYTVAKPALLSAKGVTTIGAAKWNLESEGDSKEGLTGTELPKVTVKNGTTVLTENRDYTVGYEAIDDDGDNVYGEIGDKVKVTVFADSPDLYGAKGQFTKTVTIEPAVQTMKASVDSKIYIGEGKELRSIAVTDVLDSAPVTFTSSNPAVATIDENGEITPVKAGTVTFTVSAAATDHYAGKTLKFTVSVKNAVDINGLVKVSAPYIGGVAIAPSVSVPGYVKGTDYTYVYTPLKDGEDAARNVGDAIDVTVTAVGPTGGLLGEYSKTIYVTKGVQTITVTNQPKTVYVGTSKAKLFKVAAKYDKTKATISVKSSNSRVAKVVKSGTSWKVTGVKKGTVTITVKAAATSNYNSASKTFKLTVK